MITADVTPEEIELVKRSLNDFERETGFKLILCSATAAKLASLGITAGYSIEVDLPAPRDASYEDFIIRMPEPQVEEGRFVRFDQQTDRGSIRRMGGRRR